MLPKIVRDFTEEELCCPCCKRCDISPVLLTKLQTLRDEMWHSLPINSGFRCESHNKKIGGSPTSKHLIGKAIDISTAGLNGSQKHRIMKIAGTLGFRGIGVYPTFFHLDIREVQNFWVSNGKNESQK
jgi:uncharacterized protein YcbK (DUF882 family)